MAKTRRQRQEEKRQRRIRMVMVILMVGLMGLSSFAFVFFYRTDSPDTASTGFQSEVRDGILYVQLDGQEIPFYSYPTTTIPVPAEATALLQGADRVVVLFDPTDEGSLPFVEIVRWDVANYLAVPSGSAVTVPSDEYAFPVGSCADASTDTPYLYVVNGTGGISVNQSCVVLAGQEEELVFLRDQLLYSYYGAR